jgi:hypothetical protein
MVSGIKESLLDKAGKYTLMGERKMDTGRIIDLLKEVSLKFYNTLESNNPMMR